jgi:hypothetical protein
VLKEERPIMTTSDKIWYAVIQNKADGPHTQAEIQKMLDAGKLSFTDFIFKPGMPSWTPISDVKEFERRDKDPTNILLENPIPQNQLEGWVVLVKNSNAEGKETFVQQGPLTSYQVREKLVRQEFQYDDHIWQKGYSEWKKIGSLDEFDRRRPDTFEKQPKPQFSTDKTVITDIAGAPPVQQSVQEAAAEPKRETLTSTAVNTPDSKRKIKKIAVSIGAAAIGMLVVYLGLDAYKQTLITKKPVANLASKSAAPVKIQPVLKVVSIKSNTDQKPQLVLETNLPEGTKINVEVSADLGDVLMYPRMIVKKEVSVVSGQLPMLDLSILDELPQGDYKVKVLAQGLTSQTEIKVGYHDQDLLNKLAAHKTIILNQAVKEKTLLASEPKNLKESQMKLQRLLAQAKKTKNPKLHQALLAKSIAAWKKEFNSKMAQAAWYEKQDSKLLVYPQGQQPLMTAKTKILELAKDLNKKPSSRNIASVQGEDIKKSLEKLELTVKSLK